MTPTQNDRAQHVAEARRAADRFRAEVTYVCVGLLEAGDFGTAMSLTGLLQEFEGICTKFNELCLSPQPTAAKSQEREANLPSRRSSSEKDYPRFERRGQDLVKIGRSREGDEEYEQKCPREAWDEIIAALGRIGRLTSFPAKTLTQAVSVPSYQVYLVLNYLSTLGVISVPSRGSYKLESDLRPELAAKLWTQLQ